MGLYKKILVIPGDGIGAEVTIYGRKMLEQIAREHGHNFIFDSAEMGHEAILKTGDPLPDATLAKAKNSDAILFGAVGHQLYDDDPKLKVRPEQGLFKMRKELGLFANLRPILLFEELLNASSLKPEVLKGTDIIFFRELTGDVYFGEKNRSPDLNTASDLMIYHKYEVERIAVKAFEAARSRRKKLCSIDKVNVLETSRLWREVVQDLSGRYPDVETNHMLVDTAAMQLVKNPRQFDVILTANLFGDILTDEASQLAGSMGMLASASIGNNIGFFEPIHGSAYDIAGQDKANPLASILSAALLLEIGFNLPVEADRIRSAVHQTLKLGYRTLDIADNKTPPDKILGTRQMGQHVLDQLKSQVYNTPAEDKHLV